MPGGGIVAHNLMLKEIIAAAWALEDYQIIGGPAWTETLRFEIAAKSEKNLTEPETLQSMQALLADRFELVIRHETRKMPVYHLVLARKDGRLGPKLTESKNCAEPCGKVDAGRNGLNAVQFRIQGLAEMLANQLRRPVIDQTNLTATYNFDLALSDLRSIFTALQEALGLKLESAKGPVEMLVIERAEKPKEN
jgi:uncharacterized protein (TIGR03435 family)